MNERLRELAETKYRQPQFLATLFELALEEQWLDLQHMVQHDMAKAILADYCLEQGTDYLNRDVFFNNWESVIEVGWEAFCAHTGLPREKVRAQLANLQNR